MQTLRLGGLALALAAACTRFSVDGTPEDESTSTTEPVDDGDGNGFETTIVGGETGTAGCGEIHEAEACVVASCVPLEVLPLVVDDEDATACQIGEPVVICTPPEESHACDEEARVCADQHTWVMPLPDGGAFIARVDVSCDLPDTFMPCPADGTDPTAGPATSGTSESGGTEPDPVAAACTCACA